MTRRICSYLTSCVGKASRRVSLEQGALLCTITIALDAAAAADDRTHVPSGFRFSIANANPQRVVGRQKWLHRSCRWLACLAPWLVAAGILRRRDIPRILYMGGACFCFCLLFLAGLRETGLYYEKCLSRGVIFLNLFILRRIEYHHKNHTTHDTRIVND